jgi:hypothetical protein
VKTGKTEAEAAEQAVRRRSRWPVLLGAGLLLWTAWWYCRGDDQSLFAFVAGLSAVAVALPRAFRGTARWVIWTWLAVTIACLAANVVRLVPPEELAGEGRTLDRLVTAAYAVGVTALLFRPCALGVTLTALGCLPMTMYVLGRGSRAIGTAAGQESLIVWVFVALLCAHDQVQRLLRRKAEGTLPQTARDIAVRTVTLVGVCGLAFLLRLPIEQAALALQKRLFGLVSDTEHGFLARRGLDLSLGQTMPKGFGNRLRVILLVRASGWPGYLRESVYTVYRSGRWLAPKPGNRLMPVLLPVEGASRTVYPLVQTTPAGAVRVWQVEVLAPRLLTGFCLPGDAVSLACEGLRFAHDTNGMVTAESDYPDRYAIRVVPQRQDACAYPQPDGFSDGVYLSVPPPLAEAVSNWVSACEGLGEARTVSEAAARVKSHFASNYTYQLGIQLYHKPDPLVDFMRRREGACTQFASAAALMFRSRGLPSRVVGGYVCCGWNRWLGRWVARERDGHAWVEVWDTSENRWLLVDPTPPEGQPAIFAAPGRLRLAVDCFLVSWKRLLFGLKNANLLVLIADAGALLSAFLWQTLSSPAGIVVLVGFSVIVWLRRQVLRLQRRPADRLRADLAETMRALARRAVPARGRRRVFESWGDWLLRVRPELTDEAYAELCALTEAYQELRYRVRLDEPAVLEWIVRARHAPEGAAVR